MLQGLTFERARIPIVQENDVLLDRSGKNKNLKSLIYICPKLTRWYGAKKYTGFELSANHK